MQDYVWRRIGVRKFIAGRDRVDELVEASIANWDSAAVDSVANMKELEVVIQGMVLGVKRTHEMLGRQSGKEEYGFIWIILLQALASAVVQILIKWWFESAENKKLMSSIQKELVG
jgi:hypothetical protein